jgi:hypothetical protein
MRRVPHRPRPLRPRVRARLRLPPLQKALLRKRPRRPRPRARRRRPRPPKARPVELPPMRSGRCSPHLRQRRARRLRPPFPRPSGSPFPWLRRLRPERVAARRRPPARPSVEARLAAAPVAAGPAGTALERRPQRPPKRVSCPQQACAAAASEVTDPAHLIRQTVSFLCFWTDDTLQLSVTWRDPILAGRLLFQPR